MHFRVTMNVVVLVMILEGSICGGFSYVFAFTYIHQAGVQMMDSGMMGSNINVTRNMMKTQGQLVSVQEVYNRSPFALAKGDIRN